MSKLLIYTGIFVEMLASNKNIDIEHAKSAAIACLNEKHYSVVRKEIFTEFLKNSNDLEIIRLFSKYLLSSEWKYHSIVEYCEKNSSNIKYVLLALEIEYLDITRKYIMGPLMAAFSLLEEGAILNTETMTFILKNKKDAELYAKAMVLVSKSELFKDFFDLVCTKSNEKDLINSIIALYEENLLENKFLLEFFKDDLSRFASFKIIEMAKIFLLLEKHSIEERYKTACMQLVKKDDYEFEIIDFLKSCDALGNLKEVCALIFSEAFREEEKQKMLIQIFSYKEASEVLLAFEDKNSALVMAQAICKINGIRLIIDEVNYINKPAIEEKLIIQCMGCFKTEEGLLLAKAIIDSTCLGNDDLSILLKHPSEAINIRKCIESYGFGLNRIAFKNFLDNEKDNVLLKQVINAIALASEHPDFVSELIKEILKDPAAAENLVKNKIAELEEENKRVAEERRPMLREDVENKPLKKDIASELKASINAHLMSIYEAIEELEEKSKKMYGKGYKQEAKAAKDLCLALKKECTEYAKEMSEEAYKAFKANCKNLMDAAKPKLGEPTWGRFLRNILIVVFSLGTVYLVDHFLKKKNKGRFVIFGSNTVSTAKELEKIEKGTALDLHLTRKNKKNT